MAPMYRQPQTKNDVVVTIMKEYVKPTFVSNTNAEYHSKNVLCGSATGIGRLHVDVSTFPMQMQKMEYTKVVAYMAWFDKTKE